MNERAFWTTSQICSRYHIADWQARRVVDNLGVKLPRFGLYRMIPAQLLGAVEVELRRRGWLKREAVNA
jgi:hypothetical protein